MARRNAKKTTASKNVKTRTKVSVKSAKKAVKLPSAKELEAFYLKAQAKDAESKERAEKAAVVKKEAEKFAADQPQHDEATQDKLLALCKPGRYIQVWTPQHGLQFGVVIHQTPDLAKRTTKNQTKGDQRGMLVEVFVFKGMPDAQHEDYPNHHMVLNKLNIVSVAKTGIKAPDKV